MSEPLLWKPYTRDAYAPLLCPGISWAFAAEKGSNLSKLAFLTYKMADRLKNAIVDVLLGFAGQLQLTSGNL